MKSITVYNAFSQDTIGVVPCVDEKDALAVIGRSYSLVSDKAAWLPKVLRLRILERVLAIVESRRADLIAIAIREGGKPWKDSTVEIDRGLEGLRIAIRELSSFSGQMVPMNVTPASVGRLAFTVREPRGVVLAISAFNHPFNLIIHQVIPAIAAGCPVIVKPALTTPLSCKALVDILYEAGLPRAWCQMVICEDRVAERMVQDERIGFLTFIGSAKVGWHLRSILPPGATCVLEHGGAAPVIIDDTASLDECIRACVKGGGYHAGQVCVSVQRIFVTERTAPSFIGRFVAATQLLKTGDPMDHATDVGPLIHPREVDRVSAWVSDAIEQGGTIACGGTKLSPTTYAPTIILDPSDDAKVSRAEIFGPVVCVYTVKDLAEAVRRANQLRFSFQGAIFTKNVDQAFLLANQLNGCAIMINDHTAFRVDWMPFGGHRMSGLGMGGIGNTIKDMSIEKLIVIKSAAATW